ncbi:MAG: Uroporphyrinogen decarboxylase (URO-D) [Planctomycetes bacterium ADurb.Bin401]|nr:MAG: Uroporphyrinogen decarboxylase (URO-D) [Planctomycetes bacterium ADurb.Bin401]
MQMTAKRAVESVLTGVRADRIPFTIFENKLPQCAVERQLRNEGLCIIRKNRAVFKQSMPNVKITSHTYSENGRQLVRTEYDTPVGQLHTIVEPSGFTSWTHKRLFSSPDDYKALKFLIRDITIEPDYASFIKSQQLCGEDFFFRSYIGGEPLQELMSYYIGVENFCIQWHETRDDILELQDILIEKRRQTYPIIADSPGLAFNYGGNVTPEIVGLDRFGKFYVPNYQEAAEVLHKKGKLIGVHFDANCQLLSKAISKTDLDYIEAFTPAPDTDMTLAEARKAWPEKVLWINFPSSVHLESLETIERTTRDLIKQVGSTEKFIMGITEDIPPDRWQQNMLTISRVLQDYRYKGL